MPEIDLTVETPHRRDMERWLTGRQFDVGPGPLPIGEAALEVEPPGRPARRRGRRAPGSPVAGRVPVGVPVLAGLPPMALTPDTLLQDQIEAVLAAAGKTPRVAPRTSSTQVASLMAAQGLGCAITDPVTARALGPAVEAVPLSPRFALSYGVPWPRDQPRAPAALRFAALATEWPAR